MDIERRFLTARVEVRAEGESKTIRGHAAVFDKLSDNLGGFREKIAPGAFDSVMGDDVRALFNHDPNLILGRTASGTARISVDDEGLVYEIDPPDTQLGRDLVVSMTRGDVTQSSFAFTVGEDDYDEDDEGRVIRTIRSFKRLYDVSPVTYPAYPDASVGLRGFQSYMKHKAKRHGVPVAVLYRELDLLGF